MVCFIPIIGIVVLKKIGFIQTFEIQEKRERIAPLMICLVFYLWLWVNLKNQDSISSVLIAFVLSTIIALSMSFVINNWIKISLHAVGISAFLGLWLKIRFANITIVWFYMFYHSQDGVFFFRFQPDHVSGFHLHHLIFISILAAGWIGSSRLLLKAHEHREIYIGYLVGFLSVIIAFAITF